MSLRGPGRGPVELEKEITKSSEAPQPWFGPVPPELPSPRAGRPPSRSARKADTVTETDAATRSPKADAVTADASISPLLDHFRRALGHRRAASRARADLCRELAQYNTPADRLELEAIMDRHTAEETEELRAILGHPAI
jgi:hypothetical protein